jgi:DNA polymerase III epsilon subunit-like protein
VKRDAVIQLAAKVCPLWLDFFKAECHGTAPGSDTFYVEHIRPDCDVSAEATKVNKIDTTKLSSAESFASVYERFRTFLASWQDAVGAESTVLLIAHNNFEFDKRLFVYQRRRTKLEAIPRLLFADTMVVFNSYFGEYGSLQSLARQWLKHPPTQTHNAQDDVLLLIEVVHHCRSRLLMYEGLQELSEM